MKPTRTGELRQHRRGARFLLVTSALEADALALGLLEPGGLERALAGGVGPAGRAPTAVLQLADRSERLHLRALRHGGWLGPLWGGIFWGLGRPIAELRVNLRLHAAGAPVPHPALVSGRRRLGPFWSAAVATVFEEDTRDGLAFLSARPGEERLLRACRAAGRSLRRFHDAGGRHHDLQLKNVLIRETGDTSEALLVDLDRARMGAPPSARRRMHEIMRLQRSLLKRGLADRVGAAGREVFLDAYTAAEPRLRAALLAELPREQRILGLHRLAYRRPR